MENTFYPRNLSPSRQFNVENSSNWPKKENCHYWLSILRVFHPVFCWPRKSILALSRQSTCKSSIWVDLTNTTSIGYWRLTVFRYLISLSHLKPCRLQELTSSRLSNEPKQVPFYSKINI